ncbi:hypothetical protein C0993_005036, partial [Termitomyces sp. T159_Od127]
MDRGRQQRRNGGSRTDVPRPILYPWHGRTYPLSLLTLGTHHSVQVRWSVGVQLLSQADEDAVPEPLLVDIADSDDDHSITSSTDLHSSHREPGLGTSTSTFVGTPISESPRALSPDQPHPDTHTRVHPPERHTTYYLSFPNSPSQEEAPLPPDDTPPPSHPASAPLSPYAGSPYGSTDALPLPLSLPPSSSPGAIVPPHPSASTAVSPTTANGAPGPHLLDTRITPAHLRARRHRTSLPRRLQRKLQRALAALRNFMTPPLWAALLSVVVACTRPVQHLLEAHWLSVKGALGSAGNCSIPLTLVVLGAYFYTPPAPAGAHTHKHTRTVHGAGAGAQRGAGWWNVDVRGFLGMRQPIMLPADAEGENGHVDGHGRASGIIGAARE